MKDPEWFNCYKCKGERGNQCQICDGTGKVWRDKDGNSLPYDLWDPERQQEIQRVYEEDECKHDRVLPYEYVKCHYPKLSGCRLSTVICVECGDVANVRTFEERNNDNQSVN